MTPNPLLNGEITKPTCHGGTVYQACRLQHGCLTKAIGALLRLHRAKACLSVCGWMSVCTKRGEWSEREKERERKSCWLNADWSVPACRTRWPSLASDSLGHCPGEHLSAHANYTVYKFLSTSQCFIFEFFSLTFQFTTWASLVSLWDACFEKLWMEKALNGCRLYVNRGWQNDWRHTVLRKLNFRYVYNV